MTGRVSRAVVVFVAAAGAVVAALGWITSHALRLEREERWAREHAKQQEAVRLTLWRMDAAVTPIIAREAARPYFEYQAFYPADRAYTRMWNEVSPGEVMVPSPLLTTGSRFVRLNFQVNADGSVTSPQAPAGNMRDLAEAAYVSSEQVVEQTRQLDALTRMLAVGRTTRLAKEVGRAAAGIGFDMVEREARDPGREDDRSNLPERAGRSLAAASVPQQTLSDESLQRGAGQRSEVEYAARKQAADRATNIVPQQWVKAPATEPPPASMPPASATGPVSPAEQGDAMGRLADKDVAARDAAAAGAGVKREKGEADADRGARSRADSSSMGPARERAYEEAGPIRPADQAIVVSEAQVGALDPAMFAADALAGAEPNTPAPVQTGEFRPNWLRGVGGEDELILTRPVRVGSNEVVQGIWLDWPAMQRWLVAEASDLVPGAVLVPVRDRPALEVAGGSPESERLASRLASIPAELIPVAPVVGPNGAAAWTPLRTALLLSWIAAIGAIGVVTMVLRASMGLAERRGRFVSAVTHELRTPLTTFCLYSQMLSDGMVKEEASRREYLATLKREAQRLARIVENVLEYARITRRAVPVSREWITASELIDRIRPGAAERAAQCGMDLTVDFDAGSSAGLRVDPATVERIVFNLIDNACKYGQHEGDSKRVAVDVRESGGDLEIAVRDFGKGVRADDRAHVFEPFFRGKGAGDAGASGLGLGLALSRGLARQLGGDLRLDARVSPGARFVLTLPLDRQPGA
ncbi:MAG: HAMP domain-containing histidine kinase [Phycisphaeraceae bacterium]|nr:HAMP domain-containing histidine kinase [Phycisphaeraceae bacterium]